jgi:opacity protein-like surface antigen
MKKSVLVFLALVLLTPSLAFSEIVTIKIGFFIPNAKSDLWDIEFENMDFGRSHYFSSNFCFTYEYFATKQLSFTLGIDPYYKNKAGDYTGLIGYAALYVSDLDEVYDFAFPDDYISEDFIPRHNFNVSITPIQFSMKLYPMGRQGKIMPYIGGGVGLYIWYVKIQGDLIDFNDEMYYNEVTGDVHKYNPVPGEDISIYPVYFADLQETSRFTIGYHAFAGIMVPVAQRFSFEAEFKYNYAKGNFRTGDDAEFIGFEAFDMGGYQISLGLNYWF